MVDTKILLSNEVTLLRMLNDILTLDRDQFSYSSFPIDQTVRQFHDFDTEITFTILLAISIEHLQRVLHASGEC